MTSMMEESLIFDSLFQRALLAGKSLDGRQRFNPCPRGSILRHAGTHAVLLVLEACAPRPLCTAELLRATGKTRNSICWAVAFLIRQGLVETVEDQRSPRYRRYRLTTAAGRELKLRES